MIGFSLNLFTLAIRGGFGFAKGSTMALDFTSGNRTLDPRVTFSRTTNATVTGPDGLIAYAPHNLLTFSEQFDNAAWAKGRVTISANSTAAPNGTVTADKMVEDTTASNTHLVNQTPTLAAGASLTASVYAKAEERNWIRVQIDALAPADGSAYFDLTNGTLGTIGGGSATIVPVGEGWYRCTVSGTTTRANPVVSVNLANANGGQSYTGDGTSGIYLWGAQLEVGSTATTYNPTTVKNLLGFTENFDNAAWTKSNATISATKVDDIYGQPFAQQVTSSASNGTVLSTYTAVASTPYTFSIWMKRVTGTGNIDISADGTTWATQTLTSAWQRFSVTVSPTAGSKTPGVRIATSGDSIYIFGAQLSDSASVDPYVYQPVAAPTSTAYYGPRFDYDPVTLAPKGLLVEEQRTQLLLNSSLAGTSLATQNVTVAAVAHTLSFYGTGTVTLSGVSTAGPLVGTGAYPSRATLTFTPTAGTLTLTVTGTVQFAQLEAGAFATSFIPSAASQVTRAADSASMIGNNFARWYNQTEGTLFADAYVTSSAYTSGVLLDVGAGGAFGTTAYLSWTGTGWALFPSVAPVNMSSTVTGTPAAKIAAALAANNAVIAASGLLGSVDTSCAMPVSATTLSIGRDGWSGSANYFNGTIARIAYYNRRLANTELQAITS